MGTVMLELSRQERLLRVMEERGFTLCQQNGQRTYGGPPPNWGTRSPPHRESEVFIGRLPRMCFEDELIPLFSSIGELYEFRLMLDFSGMNRGFAYAHYATEESAMNAVKILNHFEIRPGHYIGVLRSKNNCRLLFSNVKPDTDPHAFTECIRTFTNDVLSVRMFASFEELKAAEMGLTLEVEEAFQEKMARYAPNSKFAIVEYDTHKAAAVARRILIPKLGHMFAIDWAIPLKEKHHFDHNHNHHFETCSSPESDFVKVRPVPTFTPRRSYLDGILFKTTSFRNIGKYFKYLLNTTLHKSMRKGDIPFAVYYEMEKKIIERVKNIEHCGQATQLILNYLAWYSEKMMMMIDPKSEKILTEVKYYTDRLLQITYSKVTNSKDVKSEMEEYVNNTLVEHLNFCSYMAVFLSGDERDKVCGLITDSLNWFEGIMQKVRLGNEQETQFLVEISLLAGEMEEDKKKGDFLVSPHNSLKKKSNAPGWTPFSSQSFSPFKTTTLGDHESMEIVESNMKTGSPSQRSISRSMEVPLHIKENNCLSTGGTIRNEKQQSPKLFGALDDMTSLIIQSNQYRFDSSIKISRQIPVIIPGVEGGFRSHNWMETFLNVDIDSGMHRPIPALVSQPSVTDYVAYMPKAFYNVIKYCKYLIISNLQKSVERCELTLHAYRELTTKVINNVTNLELCVHAIGLILDYLAVNQDVRSSIGHNELLNALQEIRHYATSLINYVYNRRLYGVTSNAEINEFYCNLLPNQMSLLYHLTVLLEGEEKAKISGRLTESIQWLNGVIQKNKAGDVETVEFFERIFRIGGAKLDGGAIASREIVKDVYDEFNILFGSLTK